MHGASDKAQGMERQAFLDRVRAALGRSATLAPAAPPPMDDALARLVTKDEDYVAIFVERARACGMNVQALEAADLTQRVVALLAEVKAQRVVVGVGGLSQGLALREAVRRAGVEVVDWTATPGLTAQFDCDAGVCDVHAALADTGTLVCSSDAGHSRGLSLVTPVHVAILRQSDILPDMVDFWNRQRALPGADWPSSIALITGPSKTADIEGILITGVHGPGRVEILLVRDA